MDLEGIGQRLRAERERLHLSQEQLADITGTTRKTTFRYEGGEHLPPIAFLAAAGDAGFDVGYILNGKRNVVAFEADDAALLGHAAAIVDDRLKSRGLKATDEVRGRLILQVLKRAQGAVQGARRRLPSMDELMADLAK